MTQETHVSRVRKIMLGLELFQSHDFVFKLSFFIETEIPGHSNKDEKDATGGIG